MMLLAAPNVDDAQREAILYSTGAHQDVDSSHSTVHFC